MSGSDRDQMLADLLETLSDGRLSRSERREASATLTAALPSDSARRAFARKVVDAVADRMPGAQERDAVEWLWDVIGLLWRDQGSSGARAYFGPKDPMVETLQALIRGTRSSLDVAVFTVTDNRLSDALQDAHRRGVVVRLLTDDDKQHDRGSDVDRLRRAGLSVAVDRSEHHFHHKFAVADGRTLVTGSYNWTRGADLNNRENFLITEDPSLVRAFSEAFEAMWSELGSG